ncbi:MAG: coproporphyrinogen III oxidase family protein [Planctomycetes bacterium]|nr:coproporphyrinogen III oxidase family protein [Planctomycetota bacterium]
MTFRKYSPASPPKPKKGNSYLLYIHIPFCEELCPYCSFVRVKFEQSLACRYFDALKKEIEIYHKLGYCFDSVYIGGGTPTIMPDKLAQTIEFVKSRWQIKRISVETNPNHLRPEILRTLKDAGVSRLSIGVQSFNNEILESVQRLEKYGSGEEIKEKLSLVAGMFDTVNVDMIFNFPNQTEEMLAADIKVIKEIEADQITWYPLMVSNGQKKELVERCGKINHRLEKRLYKLIINQLAGTYNQQSVWCFSRQKGAIDEYIIDHDEYVGTGTGSWGYIDGTMYSNTFSIPQYITRLEQNRHPVVAYRSFSIRERIRYCFMLKLLGGTVNISDIREKYGNQFWFYFCGELLLLFITRFLTFQDRNIILTPSGRYYSLVLIRNFFSIVGDYRNIRAESDAVPSA